MRELRGPRPPRPPRPSAGAGGGARGGPLPLPRATAEAIETVGGPGRCSNLSLALNRLPDTWMPGFKDTDEKRRVEFLRYCSSIPRQAAARELLQDYQQRQAHLLASYDRGSWRCLRLRARLLSRFVCGLGIANPLEVNLLLHRLGGFPYLPGSSIKGLVRAVAEDLEGENAEVVRVAFGPRQPTKTAARGALTFFDALPLGGVALELEVMTPHHREYYSGDKWPADWQSPAPISFLSVAPGTEFGFAVATRTDRDWDADALLPRAGEWLREALAWGAGAKTSSGYGRFEVLR